MGLRLLIASDIFGATTDLDALAGTLSPWCSHVDMVDPFQGARNGFSDEEHAYAAFHAVGGMDAYVERCLEGILAGPAPAYALGFSAGASALWKALSEAPNGAIARAQLFYGRQIRHFPDCHPACPVHLVFPARETSFSIEELMAYWKAGPA